MELTLDMLYQQNGRLNAAILRREWFKTSQLAAEIDAVSSALGCTEESSLRERIYVYRTRQVVPRCVHCGEKAAFHRKHDKFNEHCGSRSCAAKTASVTTVQTKRQQYDGHGTSPQARQKARERSDELNRKGRTTLLQRYGVTNPGQMTDHLQKVRSSLLRNHGVDHPLKTKPAVEARLRRSFEFYQGLIGVDNVKFLGLLEAPSIKQALYTSPCFVVKIECDIHGQEEMPSETFKWRCRNLESPCSKCIRPYNKAVSVAHGQIAQFLEDLGQSVVLNERLTIHPLEIDILLPEKRVGIEYHGLFWHSSDKADHNVNTHLRKLELANAAGIKLIQIFEDEWIYKRDIVKSMLKAKLGLIESRIMARQCVIDVAVRSDEARRFLDENHLQGACQSSQRIGLRDLNGRLVMLLTIGASRFKHGEIELLRVCSLRDHIVIGGFQRLLKTARLSVTGEIITYADRRYSDGNVYLKSGFEHVSTSSPGFHYTNKARRFNRLQFQKHKLAKILPKYDDTLSATENMLANGYRQIWDCGQLKFKLPTSSI